MNTNPNPTNGSQDVVNEGGFPTLTTQVLGVSTERGRDLVGYILNPEEISTAVTKFFMFYGLTSSDIYDIKVGSDKDNNLKIFAEIRAKAFKNSPKKNTSWMTIEGGNEDDNETIPDKFYSLWNNKIYHGKRKNLHIRQIRRNAGEKYISIEIEPSIFIAFAYDINFTDYMYKISAPATRWKNKKELDKMSGKERKAYRAKQQQSSACGIAPCKFAVVTYSDKNKGFFPKQVDDFFDNNR